MSDRSGAVLLLIAIFFLVWAISSQEGDPIKVVVQVPTERHYAPTIKDTVAGVHCPSCLNIPEGMSRIRKTVLREGFVISTPTQQYISYLKSVCNGERYNESGKRECNKALAEIEKARNFNETLLNPIYGRPPLSEKQVSNLWLSNIWIEQQLLVFERIWVGTKKDQFMREQRGT